MTEQYRVRVEEGDAGCTFCGHGEMFTIVGPEETALSTSYGDEDLATDIAGYCNDAYAKGASNAKPAVEWYKLGKVPLPTDCDSILVWEGNLKFVMSMHAYTTAEALLQSGFTHWARAPSAPPEEADKPITETPVEPPTVEPAPAEMQTGGESTDPTDDIPF